MGKLYDTDMGDAAWALVAPLLPPAKPGGNAFPKGRRSGTPMLSLKSSAALVGMAAVVGACAARPPSGPTVWVLPKEGKDLARFRQEDDACRKHARGQIGLGAPQQAGGGAASASTGTLQWRYDLAYAQCMAASGNRTPLTEDGLAAGGTPYLVQPYGSLRPYYYDPALGGWRRRHHLGHRYHW